MSGARNMERSRRRRTPGATAPRAHAILARVVLAALVLGCAIGCGAKQRSAPVSLPPLAAAATQPPAAGSLWEPTRAANYPFVDVKPRFPGDLLTVVVDEDAEGKTDADTSLKSASSIAASVKEFFGIPNVGDINPNNVLEANYQQSYDGEGETTRAAKFEARITVTVTAVEPNGNLQVEGQKEVTLNNEKEYIVLRGVVRPEDIDSSNEVRSWRLADARIDYYGSGIVANQLRPGVFYTLFDWLWPF
jgi:flagellar L-ring protein precursor FlgH